MPDLIDDIQYVLPQRCLAMSGGNLAVVGMVCYGLLRNQVVGGLLKQTGNVKSVYL